MRCQRPAARRGAARTDGLCVLQFSDNCGRSVGRDTVEGISSVGVSLGTKICQLVVMDQFPRQTLAVVESGDETIATVRVIVKTLNT